MSQNGKLKTATEKNTVKTKPQTRKRRIAGNPMTLTTVELNRPLLPTRLKPPRPHTIE
jgi:hypothetical protein